MVDFHCDYESFLFQPGMMAPPIVCMSYAFDDEKTSILHANFDRVKLERLLWDVIRDRSVNIVAYNGASTEMVLTLAWRTEWAPFIFKAFRDGRIKDPFLIEKLKRIATGDHNEVLNLRETLLDYMLETNLDKSFHGRVRYGTKWNVPCYDWEKEWIDYSLLDTDESRRLYKLQMLRTRPEHLVNLAADARASFALSLTSAWGFPVDFAQAQRLVVETQERIEEHKQALLSARLLVPEYKKGVLKYVRKKEPATELLLEAFGKMGRDAPRGDLTATMLIDAYKECGLPPPRLGKKDKIKDKDILSAVKDGVPEELLLGNYSLDEEACKNSQSPLLLSYTRYGQADTLMKKVLRIRRAAEAGKPIQTYYSPILATGRTSSSQGKDPDADDCWAYSAYGAQTQNLPRAGEEFEDEDGKTRSKAGARECFVAPDYSRYLLNNPDWMKQKLWTQDRLELLPSEVIVSVDFDAFEMRTWAQCCLEILGYSDLADILNDTRRCPHIEMGCRLYDGGAHYVESPDWEVAYAWAYGLKKTDKGLLKKIRGLAKGPNFGLPGGMGWARLMDYCWLNYGVKLTEEQAKYACAVWRDVYREAQPYLDHISKDILHGKRGGKGTIIDGVSGFVRGGVGFCDGANGYFQARAAAAAKAAGFALMEEAYCNISSPFYGSRPLAFCHDEYLFAVKRNNLHDAGYRMRDVMVATAQRFCPGVILSASPAAMYSWAKSAGDPCHDAKGKLIPFEENQ